VKAIHVMPREAEILLGFLLFVVGVYLIWCAFEGRGKKLIWPLSGLMPV